MGALSRKTSVPVTQIEAKIRSIRSQRVMFDEDLARLYGVKTKELNKAVGRNRDRFPEDFVFRLTRTEAANLRFQIGTSSWGGRRHLPYAFTEQGVAMLSSVLRSARAARVNVEIMRTFVRLRKMLASNSELARRLDELESRYDARFKSVFDAIRRLMAEPEKPKRRIGFRP